MVEVDSSTRQPNNKENQVQVLDNDTDDVNGQEQ